MRRIPHALCLAMTLGLAACSGEDPAAPADETGTEAVVKAAPTAQLPTAREPIGHHLHANKDAQTRRTFQVAAKLERAVWRYIADNDGMPPTGLGQRNLVGKRLEDYFPGKKRLWNPITGQRTNPDMGIAAFAGSVGYEPIYDLMAYAVGFTISAMGATTEDTLEYNRYVADGP